MSWTRCSIIARMISMLCTVVADGSMLEVSVAAWDAEDSAVRNLRSQVSASTVRSALTLVLDGFLEGDGGVGEDMMEGWRESFDETADAIC